MKVRATLKKICPSCKLVRRGRKQYVICPTNARHKQRQGFHTLASDAAAAPPAAAAGGATAAGAAIYAALPFVALVPGGAPRPAAAFEGRAGALDAMQALVAGGADDDL